MKKQIWMLALTSLFTCAGSFATAVAQQPAIPARPNTQTEVVPESVLSSPEMWLYLNELRRYDDPKLAVRRNASAYASQRRSRMAARKWFGLSNARPQANPVPFMATYSPVWSGNSSDPYQWQGTSSGPAQTIIVDSPYRR